MSGHEKGRRPANAHSAMNDFALYQVATGLGDDSNANRYLNRSRNWRRHWNPEATALGFRGFLAPRTPQGFLKWNPLDCGGCYWGDHFYEALPWEYSFNAHHDMENLIQLMDGDNRFVERLEATFAPGNHPHGSDAFGRTIYNPGNEPSFTTPFLYNYVNRQDLTVKHSRFLAKSYYKPTDNGLPGNSDAGAMESWLLWVMLGLYPMTGQTTFLIGSPWFSNLTLSLGGGKTLKVTTTGGSESAYYVQSLRVNGKPWTRSWLAWDDVFAAGGTLDFALGSEPVQWATGVRPPSPASETGPRTPGAPLPGVDNPGEVPDRVGLAINEPVLAAALAGVAALGMLATGAWVMRRRRRRQRAKKEAEAKTATTGRDSDSELEAGREPRVEVEVKQEKEKDFSRQDVKTNVAVVETVITGKEGVM
jgi:hypothetical protein